MQTHVPRLSLCYLMFFYVVQLRYIYSTFADDLVAFPWGKYTAAQGLKENPHADALLNMLAPHIVREPSTPINLSCRPEPLPRQPNCSNHPATFDGQRETPAKVAHLVQFGFDVDTLEIHLNELADVVDVFVVTESIHTHYRELRKPLMWDRVKQQARFQKFNVLHFILDDAVKANYSAGDNSIWRSEKLQEQRRWKKFLEWNAATKHFGHGDIIGFGDADEVPSRTNVNLLKHCKPLKNATDIGIWFPLGDISKAFKTDFPVPGHPFSLGDPTFWEFKAAESHGSPSRNRGKSGSFLLGGMHMSDYGYIPYLMTKAVTCTECNGLGVSMISAAQSGDLNKLKSIFLPYNARKKLRNRMFHLQDVIHQINNIVSLPWYYTCNKGRYPAWELQHDHRV